MNILSIKKYYRKGSVVDEKFNNVKSIEKNDKFSKRNKTLSSESSIKADREFLEFFIDDVPLTELLNVFYKQKGSILDNWISVLGCTTNLPAEIVKLKQLLGKNVTDTDIRKVFPASWGESDFEHYLEKYRDELSNTEIIIYCCAECGDYDCGGIKVAINKADTSIIWTISEGDNKLRFEFDKFQYFDAFQRLKNLEDKAH